MIRDIRYPSGKIRQILVHRTRFLFGKVLNLVTASHIHPSPKNVILECELSTASINTFSIALLRLHGPPAAEGHNVLWQNGE
jgi:hypothetical protein